MRGDGCGRTADGRNSRIGVDRRGGGVRHHAGQESNARAIAVGLFINNVIFGRRSRFSAQNTRGGIDADRSTKLRKDVKIPIPSTRGRTGWRSHLELVVDVRAVTKTYRTKATEVPTVRNATFTLHTGEFVALTGPSGCGKSTLLNLLACVDSPTSGPVTIDGRDVSGLNDDDLTRVRRQRIGYVFQFFNLIPTMTVRENVELPLLLAGATRARAKQRWTQRSSARRSAIKRRNCRPTCRAVSSSGPRSRAPSSAPALVLADEPTGNLDSATGDEILDLLRSCATKVAAVLLATHSV